MGIVVFSNLSEALREGYQVYEKISGGYVVRTRLTSGWGFAIVLMRPAQHAA